MTAVITAWAVSLVGFGGWFGMSAQSAHALHSWSAGDGQAALGLFKLRALPCALLRALGLLLLSAIGGPGGGPRLKERPCSSRGQALERAQRPDEAPECQEVEQCGRPGGVWRELREGAD